MLISASVALLSPQGWTACVQLDGRLRCKQHTKCRVPAPCFYQTSINGEGVARVLERRGADWGHRESSG